MPFDERKAETEYQGYAPLLRAAVSYSGAVVVFSQLFPVCGNGVDDRERGGVRASFVEK